MKKLYTKIELTFKKLIHGAVDNIFNEKIHKLMSDKKWLKRVEQMLLCTDCG